MPNLKNQTTIVKCIFIFFTALAVVALYIGYRNVVVINAKTALNLASENTLTKISGIRKAIDKERLVFRETLADASEQNALNESKTEVAETIAQVQKLVQDNVAQTANAEYITEPLAKVFDLQQAMLDVKVKTNYEAAVMYSRNNGGIETTRNLDNAIDRFSNEELRLAFERSSAIDNRIATYSYILMGVIIVAFLMLVFAFLHWLYVRNLRYATSGTLRTLADNVKVLGDDDAIVSKAKLQALADLMDGNAVASEVALLQ